MTQNYIDLDVRPILRNGGEPFAEIMKAVSSLAPDQGLRLYATFKPVPLFQVLGKKGYSHAEKEIGGGDWEILFHPAKAESQPAQNAKTAPDTENADTTDWPEPAQHIDNRDLDAPEAMVRVLGAVEKMKPGEVLSALLCRKPMFLFPELQSRGHTWHGAFEPDGTTYKILIRVGGAKPATH